MDIGLIHINSNLWECNVEETKESLEAKGYTLVYEHEEWYDHMEYTFTNYVYVNYETKDTIVIDDQEDEGDDE